jgi:hypothetical protein
MAGDSDPCQTSADPASALALGQASLALALGQASLDQRSNDVAHMGLRESSDRREQFVMGERWNPICHQSIQPQFSLIWLKTKSSY